MRRFLLTSLDSERAAVRSLGETPERFELTDGDLIGPSEYGISNLALLNQRNWFAAEVLLSGMQY